jgi:hypothetical protein
MPVIGTLRDDSLFVVSIPYHPLAVRMLARLADCFADVIRLEMRDPKNVSGSRA